MGQHLKERIKQHTFTSSYQEAILGILVCADQISRKMEAVCEIHGITAAQYNVLRILRGVFPDGHPRSVIISRMINVAPDVTRLIDRLERAGFAERAKSKVDGRLSLTLITDNGLRLLEKIQPDIDQIEQDIRNSLGEAQAKHLADLCDMMSVLL